MEYENRMKLEFDSRSANEGFARVAVAAFLQEQIGFMDIPALVQWVVEQHIPVEIESFAHLMELDRWARQKAQQFVQQHRQ